MKTNQDSKEEKINSISTDYPDNGTSSQFINARDTDEIRVQKRDGFFGVTLPVMVRIPDTMAQTAANYTAPFFIAQRSYEVVEITERHELAGSDAGAVTLMVKKVPSGTAPASGYDILSAGINLKATANTNQTFTSKTSTKIQQTYETATTNTPYRRLSDGDSLALVTTGTLTALKGVTVSVILKAI